MADIYAKDWVCAKFFMDIFGNMEIFKNRPVTPFLVTICGNKSIENRELPPFPTRA